MYGMNRLVDVFMTQKCSGVCDKFFVRRIESYAESEQQEHHSDPDRCESCGKNSDVMEENVTKDQDDTSCLTKQHVFFFLSVSMFCEFVLTLSMVLQWKKEKIIILLCTM